MPWHGDHEASARFVDAFDPNRSIVRLDDLPDEMKAGPQATLAARVDIAATERIEYVLQYIGPDLPGIVQPLTPCGSRRLERAKMLRTSSSTIRMRRPSSVASRSRTSFSMRWRSGDNLGVTAF